MMKRVFPLTEAQRRIGYTESLFPDTGISNVVTKTKLHVWKPHLLEEAVRLVIDREEMIRVQFRVQKDKEWVQYISNESVNVLRTVDARDWDKDQLEEWIQEQAKSPFSLYESPLYEVVAVKWGEGGILLTKCHHILSDGISLAYMVDRIGRVYQGLIDGTSVDLGDSYTLAQYVEAEREYLASKRFQNDRQFWHEEFTTLPESVSSQVDTLYTKSLVANRMDFPLSERLKGQIEVFCHTYQMSPYSLFMSVLAVYFSRVHASQEVVLGTYLANRRRKEREAFGMFVSTLPFRIKMDDSLGTVEFMKEVKRKQMKLLRHQSYSYHSLINQLRQTGQPVKQLFAVGMDYQEIFVDLDWIPSGFNLRAIDFHLKKYMARNELSLTVDYRVEMFQDHEIKRLVKRVLHLLEQMITFPHRKLCELEICTGPEKRQLLRGFHEMERSELVSRGTIHGRFEEQVDRMPHRTALVCQDRHLTYYQLNKQVNHWAHRLREHGVKPNQPVGLLMERSIEMVVGMLAILKAGGAYVPIDPDYPMERIRYMIEDSGADLILSQTRVIKEFCAQIKPSFTWMDLEETLVAMDDSNPPIFNQEKDLAYVIYTSGTTGKPKGVMIEHQNVMSLMFHEPNPFDFNHHDIWTMFHSYCFDFSVWEMYGALLHGGKLVIVPSEVAKEPKEFLKLLRAEKVTILNQTPSAFDQLMQQEMKEKESDLSVRKVIFGGEALIPSKLTGWKRRYPQTQLVNMYGITEITVHASFKEVTEQVMESHRSPIGMPLSSLQIVLLDRHKNLVPVGVIGEIYICGEGVARGYLGKDELTQQKFSDHFLPGERMYRTGDLAYWQENGELIFIGRGDHQVKVRGFRIELGEIESVLLQHPLVRNATVQSWKNQQNEVSIIAYVVLDRSISMADVRDYLKLRLPDYMIPSYILELPEIPLNSNQKVDRKALPSPAEVLPMQRNYVPPTTELESQLVEIWQEVLGIEQIGITDHFFELGGHSFKAIALINQLEEKVGIRMHLPMIFQAPTILEQARSILHPQSAASMIRHNREMENSLFCFPPISGYGSIFAEIARSIDTHTIYGFDFIEAEDRIQQYIDAILSKQKEGPYQMLGYSAGCSLLFEVAQAMESQGHDISDLIFLDGPPQKEVRFITEEQVVQEMEEAVEEFLHHQLRSYAAFLSKPALLKQVKSYQLYLNRLVHRGEVRATIHLITSEQKVEGVEGWRAMTSQCYQYAGVGGHTGMLVAPYIEKNVMLIQRILSMKPKQVIHS